VWNFDCGIHSVKEDQDLCQTDTGLFKTQTFPELTEKNKRLAINLLAFCMKNILSLLLQAIPEQQEKRQNYMPLLYILAF